MAEKMRPRLGELTMGVKLIGSTVVIVLHNGDREIERELACAADALRAALMMVARRGRLEIGDVLKVVSPRWSTTGS